MSSMRGNALRVSVFGESHGPAIGCVIDGLPAGEAVDMDEIRQQMARRAPGQDPTATRRREPDEPEILSGWLNGKTTGAPLTMTIRNTDPHSGDYASLEDTPRPGHADYPAAVRYRGFADGRGGGHFSGRLTAPLTFAGALCKQILRRRGVAVGGHIAQIGSVTDDRFDPVRITRDELEALSSRPFSLCRPAAEQPMRQAVEQARQQLDSIGGIIEAAAVGLPAGIGGPMFDGMENRLAAWLFGIPAVKGIEFGDGFSLCSRTGSEANDPFCVTPDGQVETVTNHHGGILGGITTGMPLIVRVAFKPTPSIAQPQQTVRLSDRQPATLQIKGRHDPCIVPRALPVVEAALAVGLLDAWEEACGYGAW